MASSGPFPPEIIQGIVYYLSHDWISLSGENPPRPGAFKSWMRIRGCSRYATVNKAWQVAIERETFAQLSLNLGRLAEAEAILNGVPRRQKYVRSIRLNVVLPRPDPTLPKPHLETAEERNQKNRAVQDTFEAFLSTLSHWTPGPPVKLRLDAFALNDDGRREKPELPSYRAAHEQYHLPLELEDPERVLHLGPVNVITEVDTETDELESRRFSGAAICTLVARLPTARKVHILWHHTKDNLEERSEFNQALNNITHAIDKFSLVGSYFSEFSQPPVRRNDQREAKPDELSRSLRKISQRSQVFNLCDVAISDEIFLRHNLVPKMASPAHWARLKTFYIQYPLITPSGEWLFYHNPGVSNNQMGSIVPYPALQRRYLAAARAALEMPLLEDMSLDASINIENEWHKFCYSYNKKNKSVKAIWTSSSGFVPENEVLEAWREVPRKHLDGKELVVEILDDEWAV
ncbi:uncharacterized protein GGS22DRAFT_154258 [Annulohypoxylon maeteangense]|uniref:uncharacterized protein n=1 Tax=Annulohypoxylon maeteangense TaxID=1927788 RepID=UPI0020087D49|nr:uncharacterized protein GGS22DRAFT_154258 [Annulohypoxylon maeteangense]KAI0887775.1 hypothetical protein GGS22DRAFT_154258 [Annulohypoxylon maeteangense]